MHRVLWKTILRLTQVNLKIVFQSTRCIKSFFPYKDSINRSQQSRVIYRANCWDCNGFYIGKTKRRLHDRKTEHFKALAKNDNTSAIADHVKATGHNIKWDRFDILAKGKTDYHCKIKETLYIQELEPVFQSYSSSLFLQVPRNLSNIWRIFIHPAYWSISVWFLFPRVNRVPNSSDDVTKIFFWKLWDMMSYSSRGS